METGEFLKELGLEHFGVGNVYEVGVQVLLVHVVYLEPLQNQLGLGFQLISQTHVEVGLD